jgi:guanylate kinase
MEKLLGNLSKGIVFVMSAPAGTGKTTLAKMLKNEFRCVVESVSCTTRPPRPGEVNGRDYHFLKLEEFEAKIAAGAFLEYAQVFGHFYGTLKEYVLFEQEKGKHVLLVIDTQGAEQLKGRISAVFIFLLPPSMETLRERLEKRDTESEHLIRKRLSWAEEEITRVKDYDYCIINESLETAYQVLRSILIAEERRVVHLKERKCL